jgi:hypothetical protein
MTDSGHLTSGLLIRALDGELDVSQRLAVEQHLSVCEQCISEFERWSDLSSEVNRSIEATVRVPGEAREALAAKLIQEPRPASPRAHALRWLWPVAAAAVLAIAAILMRHDRAPQPAAHSVSKPDPPSIATPATKQAENPNAEHPNIIADRTRRKPVRTARAVVAANVPGPSFIRLPYSNPALPLDDADVIRVRMRLSSLTNAGVIHVMPGTPDNWVQADVLLGIDGEPSGIRLVSPKLASYHPQ